MASWSSGLARFPSKPKTLRTLESTTPDDSVGYTKKVMHGHSQLAGFTHAPKMSTKDDNCTNYTAALGGAGGIN